MKKALTFIITFLLLLNIASAATLNDFYDDFLDGEINSSLWTNSTTDLQIIEVADYGLYFNGTAGSASDVYSSGLKTVDVVNLSEDFTIVVSMEEIAEFNLDGDDFIAARIVLQDDGQTKYSACEIDKWADDSYELVGTNTADNDDITSTLNMDAIVALQWDASTQTVKCIDRNVTTSLQDLSMSGTDVKAYIEASIEEDLGANLDGNEHFSLFYYGAQLIPGLAYGVNDIADAIESGYIVTNSTGDSIIAALAGEEVYVATEAGVPKVAFTMNNSMTEGELLWGSLFVDADSSRTLVANTSTVGGVELTHTLYVPNIGNTGAYVCPGAEVLGDVVQSCTNQGNFTHAECVAGDSKSIDGDTVTCEIEGSNYVLSGLTGSGAGNNEASSEPGAVPFWSDLGLALIMMFVLGTVLFRRH